LTLLFSGELLVHAALEMYVNTAYVVSQPLVDGINKFSSVRAIVPAHRIAPLKPGQNFKKIRMCRLVFLGYRAAILIHTLLLEAKVATAVDTEAVEQHGIDRAPFSFVECNTEIFGHRKDHLVVLIYAMNASGVFFAPLHPQILAFAEPVATAHRAADSRSSGSRYFMMQIVMRPTRLS
jgi:hypothetical protein